MKQGSGILSHIIFEKGYILDYALVGLATEYTSIENMLWYKKQREEKNNQNNNKIS